MGVACLYVVGRAGTPRTFGFLGVDDAGFPKTDETWAYQQTGSFCHRKRQQSHRAPGSRGSRRNGGRTLGNDALVGVVAIGQTQGMKARRRTSFHITPED